MKSATGLLLKVFGFGIALRDPLSQLELDTGVSSKSLRERHASSDADIAVAAVLDFQRFNSISCASGEKRFGMLYSTEIIIPFYSNAGRTYLLSSTVEGAAMGHS